MPSFELIRSLFFTITYQESECAKTKIVLSNPKHIKQGQQPPDPSFKLVHNALNQDFALSLMGDGRHKGTSSANHQLYTAIAV